MSLLIRLIQRLKQSLRPISQKPSLCLVKPSSGSGTSASQVPSSSVESNSDFKIHDDTAWFLEANKYGLRNVTDIKYLVVHRIDVGGGTPRGIGEFFETYIWDGQLLTGGKMPYHIIVEVDGKVTKCVPLLMVAPGANKLNKPGIQIGVVGDFRKHKPTKAQQVSLLCLVKELAERFEGIELIGHDEEPTGTVMKSKVCPGKHLRLVELKDAVRK